MNKRMNRNSAAAVVVTGCAGGMGKAVVSELLAAGWHVIGIDQEKDRLDAQKVENAAADFSTAICDLSDSSLDIESVLKQIQKFAETRALVHLAGISAGHGWDGNAEEFWDEQFNVHVRSFMKLIKICTEPMKKAGWGRIVAAGSPVGIVGARKPGYAASKAAMQGLVMSAARAYGKNGISVNLLLPGPTRTYMTNDWSDEKQEAVASGTFFNRMALPKEIANAIRFLVSKENSYMTGSIVDLTCGSMYGH
ncbi:SDR family NAD(P)-dependent oxidoreductase [Spirochaeta dissipatitropha]